MWELLALAVSLLTVSTSAKTYCDDAFPGAKAIFSGVDLADVNLQGKTPVNTKSRLFELSCNENRKTNAKKLFGIEYQRPDQIFTLSPIHSQSVSTSVEQITSARDISKENQKGITVGGGYGPVTGALNVDNKEMQNEVQKGEKIYSRTSKENRVMTVDLGATPQVTKSFLKLVDRLPERYDEETKDDYVAFIKMFGTHWISKATFGGIAVQESWTRKQYLNTHSKEDLSAGLKLQFLSYVNAGAKYSNKEKKTLEEVNSFSEYKGYTRGGDEVDILKPGFIPEWQKTVKSSPTAMLAAHFNEIAWLIDDNNKRKQMKKAVRIYLENIYYKKTIGVVHEKMLKDGSNKDLKKLKELLRTSLNSKNETNRIEIKRAQQMLEDIDFNRKVAINEEWTLKVHTCDKRSAGTNANIKVNIIGKKDGRRSETGIFEIPEKSNRVLRLGTSTCKNRLERGCIDEFEFKPTNVHIGEITAITFKGDGSGFGPDWDLCEVTVTHGNKKYTKRINGGIEISEKQETIKFD